jgi:hypothetical protein
MAKSLRKVCRFGAQKYPSIYELCSEAEETETGIKTFARTIPISCNVLDMQTKILYFI